MLALRKLDVYLVGKNQKKRHSFSAVLKRSSESAAAFPRRPQKKSSHNTVTAAPDLPSLSRLRLIRVVQEVVCVIEKTNKNLRSSGSRRNRSGSSIECSSVLSRCALWCNWLDANFHDSQNVSQLLYFLPHITTGLKFREKSSCAPSPTSLTLSEGRRCSHSSSTVLHTGRQKPKLYLNGCYATVIDAVNFSFFELKSNDFFKKMKNFPWHFF